MESVTILRELWRHRILVAVIGVLALAAGWLVAYEPSFPPASRGYDVGLATARILVDTPQSQVVEVAPKGSETLGSRANVLANLMVDGALKASIAQRAGLKPDQLIAGASSTGGAEATTPLNRNSYSLTTGVVVNTDLAQLPLIKIETQAPTPGKAAALADAAIAGLTDYLDSKATTENIAKTRRLQVSGLGPAQAHDARRGPGMFMALAAAIFLFLAACTVLLLVSALVRSWRAAVDLEHERDFDVAEAELSRLLDVDGSNHHVNGRAANEVDAGLRS